jgi:glycosyltransferase 2 family protein
MKSFLKASVKILLSAAALYYVFTKIEVRDVIAIFSNVNYFILLLAMIFFIISKVISAWRLNYYFDAAGTKLETRSNLKLYLLGMYYNLFLPGGIGGDGYKIYLLNKKFNKKVKHLFWGVMLDRINGVFALYLLALAMVPFLGFGSLCSASSLMLIIISILLYVILNRQFLKLYYPVILSTTLLSFVVQIMQLIAALLILFANDSFDDTIAYLFLFLVSSIVAALPFTIGGVGSREITFLFGAKLLNLDINLSIALSLLFYIITLVVSLGGIYFSLNEKALCLKQSGSSEINFNLPS